jgi:hypothetical protein
LLREDLISEPARVLSPPADHRFFVISPFLLASDLLSETVSDTRSDLEVKEKALMRLTRLEWGLYLALGASVGLVLAAHHGGWLDRTAFAGEPATAARAGAQDPAKAKVQPGPKPKPIAMLPRPEPPT